MPAGEWGLVDVFLCDYFDEPIPIDPQQMPMILWRSCSEMKEENERETEVGAVINKTMEEERDEGAQQHYPAFGRCGRTGGQSNGQTIDRRGPIIAQDSSAAPRRQSTEPVAQFTAVVISLACVTVTLQHRSTAASQDAHAV